MRAPHALVMTRVLAMVGVSLYAVPLHVSAQELKGAARRAYEKATSEGSLSTSCVAGSPDFVFWAGETASQSRSSSNNTGSATTSASRISARRAQVR